MHDENSRWNLSTYPPFLPPCEPHDGWQRGSDWRSWVMLIAVFWGGFHVNWTEMKKILPRHSFTCMDFAKPSDGARFDLLCVPVQHLPVLKHIPFPQREQSASCLSCLCSRPIPFSARWGPITREMMFNLTGRGCQLIFGIPALRSVSFGAAGESASLRDFAVCYVVHGDISGWQQTEWAHSFILCTVGVFLSAVWTRLRFWRRCYMLACWCTRIRASPTEQCSRWRSVGVCSAPRPRVWQIPSAQSLRATGFCATLRYSQMAVITI